MPNTVIYVPMDRELYDDIIRFSDGELDPATVAEEQLRYFVERTIDAAQEYWSDDRLEEAAEKYAPQALERWRQHDEQRLSEFAEERKPMVWKEVTIQNEWQVRMAYGGEHHYGTIKSGSIVDNDGSFSPSVWASKIAGGSSRNAWRDLWFRDPRKSTWVPAQMLRDQAREELKSRGRSLIEESPDV